MQPHKFEIGPTEVLTVNARGVVEIFNAGRKLHGVALTACVIGSQVPFLYEEAELKTRLRDGANIVRLEASSLKATRPKTLDELHDLWLTFPASKRQEYSEALYEVVVGQAEFHKSEDGPYIENATLAQRLEALDRINANG